MNIHCLLRAFVGKYVRLYLLGAKCDFKFGLLVIRFVLNNIIKFYVDR